MSKLGGTLEGRVNGRIGETRPGSLLITTGLLASREMCLPTIGNLKIGGKLIASKVYLAILLELKFGLIV